MVDDRFLTPKEVMGLLRISKPHFYTLLAKGDIPAGVNFGRSRRWPAKQLDTFLSKRYAEAQKRK